MAGRPIGHCKNLKKCPGIILEVTQQDAKKAKNRCNVRKMISCAGFYRATICHELIHNSERALQEGVFTAISLAREN
jgi:hypothetical protein